VIGNTAGKYQERVIVKAVLVSFFFKRVAQTRTGDTLTESGTTGSDGQPAAGSDTLFVRSTSTMFVIVRSCFETSSFACGDLK
jgi:hypothetical protein